MTDYSQEEFDREEYDHGVDEYVSDCNKLPFTGPIFPVTGTAAGDRKACLWGALGCLAVSAVLCGGIWGLYALLVP